MSSLDTSFIPFSPQAPVTYSQFVPPSPESLPFTDPFLSLSPFKAKDKSCEGVGIWCEGAGFNPLVFWGFELFTSSSPSLSTEDPSSMSALSLSPSSDSFAQLVVVSQDIANDSTKIWKGRVSKSIFNKFRSLADKEDLYSLPSSNYDEDLSDDCFHLGASVEVRFTSRATYKHKIPTGSCVVVTGVQTQQQHQSRFLNFVRGACNLVEGIMSSSPSLSSPQVSIPVPKFITLRWDARVKDMILMYNLWKQEEAKKKNSNNNNNSSSKTRLQ